MKKVLITTALVLSMTQASAQTLSGAGGDFNAGYDWSGKTKSTQSATSLSETTMFWAIVLAIVFATMQTDKPLLKK